MTWAYSAENHEVFDTADQSSVCMVLADGKDRGPLIAAAPDLLEALEGMLETWANEEKKPGWVKRFGAAKLAARDAIAKARGQ